MAGCMAKEIRETGNEASSMHGQDNLLTAYQWADGWSGRVAEQVSQPYLVTSGTRNTSTKILTLPTRQDDLQRWQRLGVESPYPSGSSTTTALSGNYLLRRNLPGSLKIRSH